VRGPAEHVEERKPVVWGDRRELQPTGRLALWFAMSSLGLLLEPILPGASWLTLAGDAVLLGLVWRDRVLLTQARDVVAKRVLASGIGPCEAYPLGSRSITAECEAATWPLLVTTRIRPPTVLVGKLAIGFCVLSGQWLWPLPAWLATALLMGSPDLLMLPLLQVASIGTALLLGILSGLTTSRPPVPSALPRLLICTLAVAVISFNLSSGTYQPIALTAAWAVLLVGLHGLCLVCLDHLMCGGDALRAKKSP